MNIKQFSKSIVILIITLSIVFFQTGCIQNKNVSNHEQLSIYQQDGASYKSKYYNQFNKTSSIKVFDENSKQASYICKKQNCNHDTRDTACNSYGLNSRAYIATDDSLYIFSKEYNENQPGHIDIVDLKTGNRKKYADVGNFNIIYNAFLINDKIYYSDLLEAGGCAIKVFDLKKKTITPIANENYNNGIFASIKGIDNDILYYREDYYGHKPINFNMDDYYLYGPAEYNSMGAPSWYKTFIVSTSLFTYNLNTNEKKNTVKDIKFNTFTYYNKALYYVDDSKKKAHKLDWVTGKDEVLFTSEKKMYIHMFGYDDKIAFDTYTIKPTEISKYKTQQVITGKFFYDISTRKTEEFEFDDKDLQLISREHKLNNGFIVAISTSDNRLIRYAYISEDDYYIGKANLIIIEEE